MQSTVSLSDSIRIQQHFININDDYEHLEPNLEYVLENVIQDDTIEHSSEYEELCHLYNSVIVKACKCCSESHCIDCLHGGNYVKDLSSSELILQRTNSITHNIIYECSPMCGCDTKKCHNRLVQHGPRKHLKIVHSECYNSKGLVTTEDIPRGGFVCEYAGELLTVTEARRRVLENEQNSKMNYILCLNEISLNTSNTKHITIIDPSQRGNIGRYLNHSCNPNCEIYCVRVDCPIPKLGIFARRLINAGEELCFNYGEGFKELNLKSSKNCLCGSTNCIEFLPSHNF